MEMLLLQLTAVVRRVWNDVVECCGQCRCKAFIGCLRFLWTAWGHAFGWGIGPIPPGGISKVQVGRIAGDEATGRGTGDRRCECSWCNLLGDLTKRVHCLDVGRGSLRSNTGGGRGRGQRGGG